MKKVPVSYNTNVLVGFDRNDDAGVYRVSDDLALVQTLDFFTPIVDDPFAFGQIAAVNALSDVYAMGGEPITAMNIVAFPLKKFTLDVLSEILNGGLNILNKAGVQLLGGHSVDDPEIKYGLSVTGKIHPQKIIKNNGCRHGDALILTKPLGTGIIGTAVKANMAESSILDPFMKSMTTLNRDAAAIMNKYDIHACTDVTGFGLAGHLKEMITGDSLEIIITASKLPLLPGARDNAETGLIPAGLYRNRDFIGDFCVIKDSVPQYLADIVYDPQTSGGLVMALAEQDAGQLLQELKNNGISDAGIIGMVQSADRAGIQVV